MRRPWENADTQPDSSVCGFACLQPSPTECGSRRAATGGVADLLLLPRWGNSPSRGRKDDPKTPTAALRGGGVCKRPQRPPSPLAGAPRVSQIRSQSGAGPAALATAAQVGAASGLCPHGPFCRTRLPSGLPLSRATPEGRRPWLAPATSVPGPRGASGTCHLRPRLLLKVQLLSDDSKPSSWGHLHRPGWWAKCPVSETELVFTLRPAFPARHGMTPPRHAHREPSVSLQNRGCASPLPSPAEPL